MKGINTPGQALERGGVTSFSAPRGSRISPCFPGTRSVMEACFRYSRFVGESILCLKPRDSFQSPVSLPLS
ncbi:MAG: hypothetical protein JEY71_15335 [Sphaerochaeta sp.]|nr:hypothetical protein [Sphaerochaeta sp.]